jgi:hypothetical protein
MKTTFTYTVLRYVLDIATGEFVNMGVALYAPEAKYISTAARALEDTGNEPIRSIRHAFPQGLR